MKSARGMGRRCSSLFHYSRIFCLFSASSLKFSGLNWNCYWFPFAVAGSKTFIIKSDRSTTTTFRDHLKCFKSVRKVSGKLRSRVWYRSLIRLALLPLKAGVNVKALFTSLNTAFLPISRSRFKRRQIPMLKTLSTIWQFCVNFWVIFRCFGKERFFLKG